MEEPGFGAGRRRAGARGPRLNAPEPFFEEAPAYISQLWMFGLHPSSARRFLAWFAAGSMSPLWGVDIEIDPTLTQSDGVLLTRCHAGPKSRLSHLGIQNVRAN